MFDKLEPQNDNSQDSSTSDVTSSERLEQQFRELCWDVCQKRYVENRQTRKKLLTRENLQKLFCIFNSVCETDEYDQPLAPAVVHKDELALVVSKMFASIDKPLDREKFDAHFADDRLAFEAFVTLLEEDLLESSQHAAIDCMIDVVYSEYILQVVKKVSQNLFALVFNLLLGWRLGFFGAV